MSMTPSKSREEGNKNQTRDDRGIAFGVAEDEDAYNSSDFVSELPTDAEEQRQKHLNMREAEEQFDEGRVSSHPSTMARSKREVRM